MQSRFILNLLAIVLLVLSLAVAFVGWLQNQPNPQSTAHTQDDAGRTVPAQDAQPESHLTPSVLDAAIVRN